MAKLYAENSGLRTPRSQAIKLGSGSKLESPPGEGICPTCYQPAHLGGHDFEAVRPMTLREAPPIAAGISFAGFTNKKDE